MYDIHAHILPQIDDGPRSRNESLAMIIEASRTGVKTLIATPHMKDVNEKTSVKHVESLLQLLKQDVKDLNLNITLKIGMENHLASDSPDMFATGKSLTINSTKFALIELPFFGYPNYVDDTLYQLIKNGIVPVLAHPERIELIQNNPAKLEAFLDKGMIAQITSGSLIGQFGQEVKSFTEMLVATGLVHVIGSDCHRPFGRRAPDLHIGFKAAARLVGELKAKAMVYDNPKSIINGTYKIC
ncbi:MAG: tyrosine protein phosphatase [Dehalococcoidia bacterium]|nr:tyrosine protein phosphatase [Dehalococcoidia bacterium]MQG16572.1 tyrosine protein phosphatase [SAR202 cluster bacterium]|tara:strand:- start:80672 stop:81397 length:726 start_codon:yes stop_codon:yes gene_type:complete